MVELIALWIICKNIGAQARARKLLPRPFQTRAVVLWFVFEFIGVFVGAMFQLPLVMLMLVGWLFAFASLYFSFAAVQQAKP